MDLLESNLRALTLRARVWIGVWALLALTGCAVFGPAVPPEVPVHRARGPGGTLRAGAAAVDVTPDGPVWMGGYGFWRRSEGVHDPLYARALVLDQGGFRLALVAMDVVGLQRGDVLKLHERIAREGFDPRHVVLTSTHNHSGPDTVGLWGLPPFHSGQSDRYMARLGAGILDALRAARDALRPAEIAVQGIQCKRIFANSRSLTGNFLSEAAND